MSIENSPVLEDVNGLPPKPTRQAIRLSKFHVLILVLTLVVVALLVLKSTQDQRQNLLAGNGTVIGKVVDNSGAPIPAQALILGASEVAQADQSGLFKITSVPPGERILVIGYQNAGWEFPVQVQPNTTTNLGTFTIQPTAIP
jgi:hypothetical protein